jgi:hypothetical protein
MLVMEAMPDDATVAALFPGSVRDDARTRVLDLGAAALEEPDAQLELARLATRGFVVAYARCWTWVGGTAYVTVYELGSQAQAQLATLDLRETLRASGGSMSIASPGSDGIICAHIDEGVGRFSEVATGCIDRLHVLAIVANEPPSPVPEAGSAVTLLRLTIDRGRRAVEGV